MIKSPNNIIKLKKLKKKVSEMMISFEKLTKNNSRKKTSLFIPKKELLIFINKEINKNLLIIINKVNKFLLGLQK